MRKHNGMRPQDVAILLKLCCWEEQRWQLQDLSNKLLISMAEISQSLDRSRAVQLIDAKKKQPLRSNLLEFLLHGVRYVFPALSTTIGKGIFTAHSHPFLKRLLVSETKYVWPDQIGEGSGRIIIPFYDKQVLAIQEDPKFYRALALVDVIRIGEPHEAKVAGQELRKLL